MFCFHHNLLPNAISPGTALGIQTNSQNHSHYTRASHYYRSQFARVKIKQFSILCSGPTIWNKLPEGMKNLNSLGSFKFSLRKYLTIIKTLTHGQSSCNNSSLTIILLTYHNLTGLSTLAGLLP